MTVATLLLVLMLASPHASSSVTTITDQGWFPTPFQGQGYGPNETSVFYVTTMLDRLISIDQGQYSFRASIIFDINWPDGSAFDSIHQRTTDSQLGNGTECNRYCSSYRWQGSLPFLCCDSVFMPTFVIRNVKEYPPNSLYWSLSPCNDNSSMSYRVALEAEYFAAMNFRNFPFDSQRLGIYLEFLDVTRDKKPYVLVPSAEVIRGNQFANYLSGWELSDFTMNVVDVERGSLYEELSPFHANDTCVLTRGYGGFESRYYGFEAVIEVTRISWVFMLNVVVPLFLIGLLAFTTFMFSAEDIGTRLGILSTMLVALMAAQWVVGDKIPDSSYVIPPQAQVLLNYILFMVLVFENCVVAYIVSLQEHRMTWNRLKQRKFATPMKLFARILGRTWHTSKKALSKSFSSSRRDTKDAAATAAIAVVEAEELLPATKAFMQWCVDTIMEVKRVSNKMDAEWTHYHSGKQKVLLHVARDGEISMQQKALLLQELADRNIIDDHDVKEAMSTAWDVKIARSRLNDDMYIPDESIRFDEGNHLGFASQSNAVYGPQSTIYRRVGVVPVRQTVAYQHASNSRLQPVQMSVASKVDGRLVASNKQLSRRWQDEVSSDPPDNASDDCNGGSDFLGRLPTGVLAAGRDPTVGFQSEPLPKPYTAPNIDELSELAKGADFEYPTSRGHGAGDGGGKDDDLSQGRQDTCPETCIDVEPTTNGTHGETVEKRRGVLKRQGVDGASSSVGDQAERGKGHKAVGFAAWTELWKRKAKVKPAPRRQGSRRLYYDRDYCMWLARMVDKYSFVILLVCYSVSSLLIFVVRL